MRRAIAWIVAGILSLSATWLMSLSVPGLVGRIVGPSLSMEDASIQAGFSLVMTGIKLTKRRWTLEAPSLEIRPRLQSILDGSPPLLVEVFHPALEISFQKERFPRNPTESRGDDSSYFLVRITDGIIRVNTGEHDLVVAGCDATVMGARRMVLSGRTFAYSGTLGRWTGQGPVVRLDSLALSSIVVRGAVGKPPWGPSLTADLDLSFTGPVLEASLDSASHGATLKARVRTSMTEPKGEIFLTYTGSSEVLKRVRSPLARTLGDSVEWKGSLTLEARGERKRWEATATVDASSITINHRLMASHPVTFRNVRARVGISFHQERFRVTGELLSPLRMKAIFTAQGGEQYLDVDIPQQRCSEYIRALSPLLGPLAAMKLRGRTGWHLSFWRKDGDWKSLQGSVRTAGPGCRVVSDVRGFDPHDLAKPVKLTLIDAAGRRSVRDLSPGSRDFYPLARVPSWVVGAFVAAEDRRFFSHHGFDWPMLVRALGTNLAQGRIVKGGSTITNQLVKNVYLSPERTVERKIREALLTWRTEQVLTKRRIIELYLNIIEMGPGRRGIREGALLYFRKSPSRLSPIEACHLALITRAPTFYYKYFKRGIVPDSWMAKIRRLLRKVYQIGSIDRKRYLEEKQRPLIIQPLP